MLPELYLDRRLAELQWVRGYAGVPGESGPIAWQENPLSNGRGQSQDISLVYLKLKASDMYDQGGSYGIKVRNITVQKKYHHLRPREAAWSADEMPLLA